MVFEPQTRKASRVSASRGAGVGHRVARGRRPGVRCSLRAGSHSRDRRVSSVPRPTKRAGGPVDPPGTSGWRCGRRCRADCCAWIWAGRVAGYGRDSRAWRGPPRRWRDSASASSPPARDQAAVRRMPGLIGQGVPERPRQIAGVARLVAHGDHVWHLALERQCGAPSPAGTCSRLAGTSSLGPLLKQPRGACATSCCQSHPELISCLAYPSDPTGPSPLCSNKSRSS